jgi:hypothetical protein
MPDKHIAQLAHDSFNGAFVDIDIRSAKIAYRFENAMWYRITDKPGMPARVHAGPTDCQPEFKRHVETRGARGSAGKLNSRQVVNGIPTLMQKCLDAIKAPCSVRNFQGCVWDQPKGTDADDICKVQPFES